MSPSMTHESAPLHAQGLAAYIDDLPLIEGTLHAAPILSQKARGHITSLDVSAVRSSEGVVAVVRADETEQGQRALLNLGHTFGHAIENVAGYGEYLHGEAVAIGLVAAAHLSQHLGLVDSALIDRVERILAAHALPKRLRAPLPLADLRAAMSRDKKVRAGGLRFVVLRALGDAATQGNIPPEMADASFRAVGAV